MRVTEWWVVICLAAGCGGGAIEPAELVLDEEACSHCRMAVSQKLYAAQAVSRSGRTDFFDDIACLAKWAPTQTQGDDLGFFVVDQESGEWLDARAAYYMRSDELDTPMSSGLAAFGRRERAEAAARKLEGRVLDWDALCGEEIS
jgi:copper chaperone NosL